jgi:hypothetical protein
MLGSCRLGWFIIGRLYGLDTGRRPPRGGRAGEVLPEDGG